MSRQTDPDADRESPASGLRAPTPTGGAGATVRRILMRGLTLPAELYLQPERFAREINALAPEHAQLTILSAARDRRARRPIAELLASMLVAMLWAVALCGAAAAAGVTISWTQVVVGVAGGVAVGVTGGVAAGVAVGVAFGVTGGVASGVAFGVTVGVAFGVAVGVAFGVTGGVASGVAFGVTFGVTGGVAAGVAFGVAAGVAFILTTFRLLMAPVDVAAAWRLDSALRRGLAPASAWARHPARWDPHGRFALPGLARLLAALRLELPALAIEAERIVAANPTRRPSVAAGALLAIEQTISRVATLPALAALPRDLEPLDPGDLLDRGERAELDVLIAVGEEVAASREATSATNRVQRLGAARRRLNARAAGSRSLARYRPQITQLVNDALHDAEARRRQLEPIPPVYRDSGTPLEAESTNEPTTFKGRGEVFARLEQLLSGPHRTTVILHGPRRSGKTSLLKQLPRRLGPSAIPVFVDLQGSLGAAERAATLLSGLAHAITRQAHTHRSVAALPELPIDTLESEPYVAFGSWLDDVEKAIADHHVLLCIDEFETLDDQIRAGRLDVRILDLLRSIVQHRQRITVALTGSHTLGELPGMWASRLVSTEPIELGPLPVVDAQELVTHPVPGFPDIYTPAAVDRILRETACEPFLLQVMCAVLVDTLNTRHWTPADGPIDAADVSAAADDAVQRAQHYFLNLWQESIPAPARRLVRALARPDRTPTPTIDETDSELIDAILALQRYRVLSPAPTGGYTLTVPLFARYVRTHQSITQ